MKITLITPAGPGSRYGNRNTAARWAGLLRELGHRVTIQVRWDGDSADLMIALHARRSRDSIVDFRAAFPDRPLVVALTGTDLYRDIHSDAGARASLAVADRLVVLQDEAVTELSRALRRKTHVIYQSAHAGASAPPLKTSFEVVVSGHLREEKDPFRAAAALQLLPPESRIRITHIGGAMTTAMAREARAWAAREPRYHWLGELPHWKALRLLGRSRLMVISSRMEGGANVVCEALASRVPVIASRISGNIGMLGRSYSGYFPVENERALARLLLRAETDSTFLNRLRRQIVTRRDLVRRDHERNALARLIADATSGFKVRSPRSATG